MQHDYVISNAPGASVRADLNAVLQAIVTNNSGPTEPATMFPNMLWYDTSTNTLKKRNEENTAWVDLISDVDGSTLVGLANILAAAGVIPVANLPVGTTANKIVQLNGDAKLPAVDGSQLTGIPDLGTWKAVQSGSVTAQTSFTISSLVASGKYKLIFTPQQNTSAGDINIRFNGDSGGNYSYARGYAQPNGMSYGGGSGATFFYPFITLLQPTEKAMLTLEFFGTSDYKVFMNGLSIQNGGIYTNFYGGIYTGAADLSSITVLTSAGTMTGTWTLYKLD